MYVHMYMYSTCTCKCNRVACWYACAGGQEAHTVVSAGRLLHGRGRWLPVEVRLVPGGVVLLLIHWELVGGQLWRRGLGVRQLWGGGREGGRGKGREGGRGEGGKEGGRRGEGGRGGSERRERGVKEREEM